MKIAIVTETFVPSVDGVVTRITATIKWLRKKGHQLLVIAPEQGINEYDGIPVEGIPSHQLFIYNHRRVALPHPRVGRLLGEFQPDIVHVVNPALLGMAGIFYGRKWPLVASWHTNIPDYADYYRLPYLKPALWWMLRWLHNRADINLCTSQSVQLELKKRKFKNVHLWKRGVDANHFGPHHRDEGMRHRLTNGETDKLLLLYVGRLAAEKEIERIRSVFETTNDIRLAIVGDGPHRYALEAIFQGTPTVFIGYLHGKELAQAYASSDVFVFPSTTETLGLVILEAMASGLPVVAANNGPSAEQVVEGKTGFLFDPQVGDDLKKVVMKLTDAELRQTVAMQSYKTAQRYSWTEASEQLLSYYDQLLVDRKRVNVDQINGI